MKSTSYIRVHNNCWCIKVALVRVLTAQRTKSKKMEVSVNQPFFLFPGFQLPLAERRTITFGS